MTDKLISGVAPERTRLRCLPAAVELLLVLLALLMLPTGAHAAFSCIAEAGAPFTNVRATVSGGTSIAQVDAETAGAQVTCQSSSGDQITQMQMCAAFTTFNASGGYFMTFLRTDGRTPNDGSMKDRLIAIPLDGQGNEITTPSIISSMLPGQMITGGFTGVAQFPIRFRFRAAPGAVIEAGDYAGNFIWPFSLVEVAGPPAGPSCTGTSIPPRTVITGTVAAGVLITVPSQCTMTQPSTLDFGQHTSIADAALQASSQFSVNCNSDQSKFHVYIDEGQNATAGQRRMKRTGSEDYIAYDLLDESNTPFPTTAVANTASGKYFQTTSPSGTLVGINGRVPQQSGRVRDGSYTDRVTIHVQY